MEKSYDCNWPSFPFEYKPLFPRSLYAKWLRAGVGTPEQQSRYQEAIDWYSGKRKPSPDKSDRRTGAPKAKPKRKRKSFDERRQEEFEKLDAWRRNTE